MARKGRRNIRRRFRRRRNMRKVLSGGLVRGRMHPNTTSASPWNSYFLVTKFLAQPPKTKTEVQCVALSIIRSTVKTELGLKDDIDMRILRIDVWTVPAYCNSDKNYIVMAPSDWSTRQACVPSATTNAGNVASINWYEAWGTAVQPANLHYVWPKPLSNLVLTKDTDLSVVRFDVMKDMQYIVRYHITWRPSVPDPRPDSFGITTSFHRASESPDDCELTEEGYVAMSPLAAMVKNL